MAEWIHPGILIMLGAFLTPFLVVRRIKQAYIVILPTVGLIILVLTSIGYFGSDGEHLKYSYWIINGVGLVTTIVALSTHK